MFYNNHSIVVPDPTPTGEDVSDPAHTEEAVPNPPPTGEDVSNPAYTGEVVQEPVSNYQTSAQVAPQPAKLTLETPLDLGKTDIP